MIDHSGFLEDILNHPDNNSLRLIYADWLEDNGQSERANLIRVQIELSLLGDNIDSEQNRKRSLELQKEEDKLIYSEGLWATYKDRYTKKEIGILASESIAPVFVRGFPEEVCCSSNKWKEIGPEIVRKDPIKKVALYSKEPYYDKVFYSWIRTPDGGGFEQSYNIDTSFFTYLISGKISSLFRREYNYEFNAISDLSNACIEWAKANPCNNCKGKGYFGLSAGETLIGYPVYTKSNCSICHGVGRK